MSQPFLGQICIFGFTFAPRGWALCNGQILSISQNTALFSLLGTIYGGNGQTTFALPNLQSRVPLHYGTGPGLSTYDIGQLAGTETVTLTVSEIPAHIHAGAVKASTAESGLDSQPTSKYPAAGVSSGLYASSSDTQMAADSVQTAIAGGSQPHSNLQPYLAVNFCIALQGIFPSRN
jgi:microcystin-dependent protein